MSDDKCSIIEGCMQLRATYDVAPSSTAAMADDGIGGMATMAVAAPEGEVGDEYHGFSGWDLTC